jgi:hypothetical protein
MSMTLDEAIARVRDIRVDMATEEESPKGVTLQLDLTALDIVIATAETLRSIKRTLDGEPWL